MTNRDGILILESAGHEPVGGIGTQTFSLYAQRSCTPLNKRPQNQRTECPLGAQGPALCSVI